MLHQQRRLNEVQSLPAANKPVRKLEINTTKETPMSRENFFGCRLTLAAGSFLKQRRRELLRVERLQIVRLFADADEFDGQAEFLLKRDDHAAFARAVEFGDDEPRELHRFVKFTRLVQGVHAGGAVEH